MSTYSYKLVNEESVSAVTATPSVQVGTRRLVNGNEYVYCYNDGGAANKGAPCILTSTSGYSFVITYATAANTSVAFLGLLNNATCAAGSYAWVCTRGFGGAYVVSAAVVAGDNLWIKDGGGQCSVVTFTSLPTIIVGKGIIGRALSTQTAAATGCIDVYMR
jgi:hypothetical protein